MKRLERFREILTGPLTPEHLSRRQADGWDLAAVIWEREVDSEPAAGELEIDIPYGLRISKDCARLEDDPAEKEVLVLAMQLIVQDRPLSQVAQELNRQGHKTRAGTKWTPGAVFDLLPRLIEVGPRIFTQEEWPARRRHFLNLT